jgi:uncharacterized protein (DUF488 family)
MFIFNPAKGIFGEVVISKNIEKIKEHLNTKYEQEFIYVDHTPGITTYIGVYKNIHSSKYDNSKGLLMGYIQNMDAYIDTYEI